MFSMILVLFVISLNLQTSKVGNPEPRFHKGVVPNPGGCPVTAYAITQVGCNVGLVNQVLKVKEITSYRW